MNAARIGVIARLELTQRVRSVAWYVLLGVFAVLLVAVTALSFSATGMAPDDTAGATVFSIVVYFVLLLVVLVSPTLSGNAINGDRDAATLAPVQVTLATTGDILVGKLLAAWVTGLAFLAVAVPFLVLATVSGGVSIAVLLVSLLVLVVEVGVVAAIGVGLSGILARPLFSVAVTYLTVAALVLGTPIAFGLATAASHTTVESRSRNLEPVYPTDVPTVAPECMTAAPGQTEPLPQCTGGSGFIEPQYVCGEWTTSEYRTTRSDHVWWLLAANPFIVLADATPSQFVDGYPRDLFGSIKVFIRSAQLSPEVRSEYDGCAVQNSSDGVITSEDRIEGTTPSWFVGLAVQIALAALLLWRAAVRTRTPAKRMPPGTRIA
ncbi:MULTISPECIES: ABC transporter permease [unclassified Microbacterium]|uniref:ABC transporter permease n=1 Tax=unclassified Microbacterium TaxID=2609290 RepID=UPI000D56DC14|nr:ABC transporter permease subunit [Microbacterium sp. Gd 4-13]PVW05294.1 ABC transporter permease [Microbacterium sp. Gd 4-13]